jgi:DnaJ-class molecular chaperone
MTEDKSYYDILGINKNATDEQIKSARRTLVFKCHPDKLPESKKVWGEQQIKLINEAYNILIDPKKRQIYDAYGKDGLDASTHNDGFNPFGSGNGPLQGFDIFDMLHKKKKQQQHDIVKPIQVIKKVSLKDMYFGSTCEKEVNRKNLCQTCSATGFADKKRHLCKDCNGNGHMIQTRKIGMGMIQQVHVKCGKCHGTGRDTLNPNKCKKCNGERLTQQSHKIKFKIDPGMMEGDIVSIPNEGDECLPEHNMHLEHNRGQINIVLKEIEDPIFKRGFSFQGQTNIADLLVTFDITLAESLCGFSREIAHIDGRKLFIEENDIVKNSTVRVMCDEGMPYRNSNYKKGNIFVRYLISYPVKLTIKQKDEIAKILGYCGIKPPSKSVTNSSNIVENDEVHFVHLLDADEYLNRPSYTEDSDEDGGNHGNPVECRTQ